MAKEQRRRSSVQFRTDQVMSDDYVDESDVQSPSKTRHSPKPHIQINDASSFSSGNSVAHTKTPVNNNMKYSFVVNNLF